QIANGGTTGSLGGIVIVTQSAHVTNHGTATAKTGGNRAIGNDSDNLANTVQGAVSGRGPPGANSVANNDGLATNHADGTARINTGDASATGNDATTTINQWANYDANGNGSFAIVDQSAPVFNRGTAVARTGNNNAVGNDSFNTATNNQRARTIGGRPRSAV